ncbi:ATP-binding protein [Wenjunlia vitaminophila]|uniref:ATP-binding protein n=1 Tax=Wenjunlia vitaminophila TaxID=76728 RepID=A0A0T6LTQ7_WENVI|nr:ATP-binding protein [Wenjunlia vitaminophila]
MWPDRVLDLRRGPGPHPTRAVRALCYPVGDVVVVSGLPGSGKSTLIDRTVAGARGTVRCLDSQEVRERWERRLPRWVPYLVYRPVVRVAHYCRLLRAARSGLSLVVHDCGSVPWVRSGLARLARRRGRGMHLLVLDVPPEVAVEGQRARGRRVSDHAFARHRRACQRLVEGAVRAVGAAGSALPPGCVSAVLIDRPAARELRRISFGG